MTNQLIESEYQTPVTLSINPRIINKPIKRPYVNSEGELTWGYFVGDRKISLSHGWTNVTVPFDQVFELLINDGWAVAPALKGDHRNSENFLSADLVFIDCDNSSSIKALLTDAFYKACAAGFYTTPSHTEEKPRYRIVHRLATTIKDAENMRLVTEGLMLVYDNADVACKDPSRLFFGSADAVHAEIKPEVLSDEIVKELIAVAKEARKPEIQKDYELDIDIDHQHIIKLLAGMPVLDYARWRNIGWGLKTAGFSEESFIAATAGMMREKTADDARAVWRDGKPGQITLGTVIHELRTHYGSDVQIVPKEKSMSEQLYGESYTDLRNMKGQF